MFPIFSILSLTLALISYDQKISLKKVIKRDATENRQNPDLPLDQKI
jgi:hypothetical protein